MEAAPEGSALTALLHGDRVGSVAADVTESPDLVVTAANDNHLNIVRGHTGHEVLSRASHLLDSSHLKPELAKYLAPLALEVFLRKERFRGDRTGPQIRINI